MNYNSVVRDDGQYIVVQETTENLCYGDECRTMNIVRPTQEHYFAVNHGSEKGLTYVESYDYEPYLGDMTYCCVCRGDDPEHCDDVGQASHSDSEKDLRFSDVLEYDVVRYPDRLQRIMRKFIHKMRTSRVRDDETGDVIAEINYYGELDE